MTSAGDPVLRHTQGQTRILELNRPQRLNAVSLELYTSLIDGLSEAEADGSVRAIVLTGAGRAFCVGADLKAHGEGRPDPESLSRYVQAGQDANLSIQRCGLPVVAAVNGHAIGAGLELALSADFMIVADDAKLRLPEVGLGTFIGGGVTYTLAERVGALVARELIMLGRFFSGGDAVDRGVANLSCDANEVLPTALEWAQELSTKAPLSLARAKRLLADPVSDRSVALDREAHALLDCMASEDWQEGVDAFAEKRTPNFRGR